MSECCCSTCSSGSLTIVELALGNWGQRKSIRGREKIFSLLSGYFHRRRKNIFSKLEVGNTILNT